MHINAITAIVRMILIASISAEQQIHISLRNYVKKKNRKIALHWKLQVNKWKRNKISKRIFQVEGHGNSL